MKRILILAILSVLPLAAHGQTSRGKTMPRANKVSQKSSQISASRSNPNAEITPLVDYHTHIFSADAYAQIIEPLLPAVNLPEELDRLLRDKERFGGKNKNPTALTDLYTKDVLVLDATRPTWLRGARAIRFIVDLTEIHQLLPSAYEVNGAEGYIAGTETDGQGSAIQHLSNFLYVIRKEADGKWRISSEVFTLNGPPVPQEATAERLIAHLDAEGIKRAVVLSTAYWYGRGADPKLAPNEYTNVRKENDWVAQQVAHYPNRLVGFCSFNPLKEYAVEELNRCAKNPNLKGLKLHLGNSRVDLLNPQHVEKLRQVFRVANDLRMPIVVHTFVTGGHTRERAEAFLKEILSVAPDIPVQIAHLGGSGPNYDGEEALAVYAEAITAGDKRMKNVYFDVASEVTRDTPPETLALVARRLRQLGLQRVVYGSDRAGTKDDRSAGIWDWKAFRRLPLTEKEFRMIAANVTPYAR
jgi:predicted TIM-barrel fold metal-dependent hydrolase